MGTGDNSSFVTLRNKLPLLVTVKFWVNTLAILLPNGVSLSNNARSQVKYRILLSDINPI